MQLALFTPNVLTGLVSWLRSDQLITLAGAGSTKVSAWGDRSGAGNLVTQAVEAQQPTYVASGGANNLPYLLCGQSVYSQMNFPANCFTALTAAEGFFVFNNSSETLAQGLFAIGQTSTASLVPFVNKIIYDGFGSTIRHDNAGTFTGQTLTTCVYNVSAATNSWTNSVNGTQLSTTGTNTVQFDSTACLFTIVGNHAQFLNGKFYEYIMFNRVLSTSERALVNAYTYKRYGIVGI